MLYHQKRCLRAFLQPCCPCDHSRLFYVFVPNTSNSCVMPLFHFLYFNVYREMFLNHFHCSDHIFQLLLLYHSYKTYLKWRHERLLKFSWLYWIFHNSLWVRDILMKTLKSLKKNFWSNIRLTLDSSNVIFYMKIKKKLFISRCNPNFCKHKIPAWEWLYIQIII